MENLKRKKGNFETDFQGSRHAHSSEELPVKYAKVVTFSQNR